MQRKTKGILLTVTPVPLLFFLMTVYFVVRAILSNVDGDFALTLGIIANLALSLGGLAAVIGILVGIPVGIYLLTTEDKAATAKK